MPITVVLRHQQKTTQLGKTPCWSLDIPLGVIPAYDFIIKRDFIAPDGVNKSVILVTGQFPAVRFSGRIHQLSLAIYWLGDQPTIEAVGIATVMIPHQSMHMLLDDWFGTILSSYRRSGYCGAWSLASEFSMNFSSLFLLGRATAGAHCREELRPFNRSLSRREHEEKNLDLSTSLSSDGFRRHLVMVGAELVAWVRFNRESEFGVFKMGEWLRTVYFPTPVFKLYL